jgi:hypothetical protein
MKDEPLNYIQLGTYFQDLCVATKILFKNGITETEIINEVLLAIGECEEEETHENIK